MIPLDLFEKNMAKLSSFFGKKLSSEQVLLYYEQLKYIPAEAFEEITEAIIRGAKPNPSNFPSIQDLQSSWVSWQGQNQHRLIKPEIQPCDECGGAGYIEVWRKDNRVKGFIVDGRKIKYWANMALPCSQCKNWKRVFPTAGENKPKKLWTRKEALSQGFLLHNPYWHGVRPYWKEGWELNDTPKMVELKTGEGEDEKERDIDLLVEQIFSDNEIPF